MQEVFFTVAIIIAIGYLSFIITGFIAGHTCVALFTASGLTSIMALSLILFWVAPVVTAVIDLQALLLCYKVSAAIYALGLVIYVGNAMRVSPNR